MQRSTGIRLRAELYDDKSNLNTTADEPEDVAVPHRRRLWFLRLIRVHPRNPRSSIAILFLPWLRKTDELAMVIERGLDCDSIRRAGCLRLS